MKICILDCDDAKAWAPISFSDMFKDFICKENDSCVLWNIARENCLPERINEYDIVVLTGSRYNCRDCDKLVWIGHLCDFVRQAASTGAPRIYGGCFGCQIIAHSLGGTVGYNPQNNLILKAEHIKMLSDVVEKHFGPTFTSMYNSTKICENHQEEDTNQIISFNLIESHGDCVLTLPPNSELLGTSDSCLHEIFITGKEQNILACQSHPEFELQYSVYDRIWPEAVERCQRLQGEDIEISKQSFANYTGKDALYMREMISFFLHK